MDIIYGLHGKLKKQVHRSLERDRANEKHVKSIFRILWPWNESWLIALIFIGVTMDFCSTYILLELSGKPNAYEAGLLASRALNIGGWGALILMDIAAVTILLTVAFTAKKICLKLGFEGYARAMFIAVMLPYVIMAFYAATNNLTLTFV